MNSLTAALLAPIPLAEGEKDAVPLYSRTSPDIKS